MMLTNEVSRPIGTERAEGRHFHFGLDSKKAADQLRELAADIESGTAIIQTMILYGRSEMDDYAYQAMVIKFARATKPSESELKELRGSNSVLPEEIVRTQEKP